MNLRSVLCVLFLAGCHDQAEPLPDARLAPLPIAAASSSAAEFTGHYYYGPEVESFSACADETSYWVVGTRDILDPLQQAHSDLTEEPYEGLFVKLMAEEGPPATDGFAEDYDATLRITEVLAQRPRTDADCQGEPPAEPLAEDGYAHPIDVRLKACQEEVDWTTHGVADCYAEAIGEWDAELNRVYRELNALLDDEEQATVRAAQRAWLAFRDADAQAMGLTYRQEMGTGWVVELAIYQLDRVRTRVEELQWLREAFEQLKYDGIGSSTVAPDYKMGTDDSWSSISTNLVNTAGGALHQSPTF